MGCCKTNDLSNVPEIKTIIKTKNSNIEKSQKSIFNSMIRVKTNSEDINLNEFIVNMLKLHNDLRKKYNSPELRENQHLNLIAESYAKNICENGVNCFHENIYKGSYLGENIAIITSKEPEDIFRMWSMGEIYYISGSNLQEKKAYHFTQIICKETTDIGINIWYDSINNLYITVVLYYPIGNTLENFSQNVA